jgi:hypothetical protein
MTAKEYLRQLKYLDNRINAKLLEREQIRTIAEKTTVSLSEKVQTSSGTKMDDVVVRLVELEELINKDIDKLVYLKEEAGQLIDKLVNERYKWALKERYIKFKSLSWLSDSTGLGVDGVRSLLKRAEKHFNTIYSIHS